MAEERKGFLVTCTQVLFPSCTPDGSREEHLPVTSARVFFSKCTPDGSKETVPALRVLPASHRNGNPDPWFVNPVLGPPHASSLRSPPFARGGRDSHYLHLTQNSESGAEACTGEGAREHAPSRPSRVGRDLGASEHLHAS